MTGSPGLRLARFRGALRSLRLQVSIALLVGAAACAYVASTSSGNELRGAYEDSADVLLSSLAEDFRLDIAASPPATSEQLQQRTARLAQLHEHIAEASVWGVRDGRVVVLASNRRAAVGEPVAPSLTQRASKRRPVYDEVNDDGMHLARVLYPLPGGRAGTTLELAYDLDPTDAALADRSRRFALILTALLLGFTAFTALVLGRGIFRPLHKLRLATRHIREGDLGTRLRWSRRDELGVLACDFDRMADALEASHERLRSLALEDALTGLANHRCFQEVLAERLNEAEREGRPLAVVALDLDAFKRVNDARGHTFGDEMLRAVGHRLNEALSGLGLAARLGGDEFGIILPDTGPTRAHALAEAARAAVEEVEVAGYRLGCSAGIACYPEDSRQAAALVQLADGALYWAKRTGRGQTRRYHPEHVLVVTDEQRAVLDDVLEHPESIKPVFQPLVRLSTGSVAGYEALARFTGGQRKPPSWWFEQAHRFGLGARLEAEAVTAALGVEGRPDGTFLSFNVSLSALMAAELRDRLPDDLNGLVIEITEHEQVRDERALQAVLRSLRVRGARIAVDDAGAGYAGLQQVMRIGADIIKLDRTLVDGVCNDRAKAALVGSFVSFAATTKAEVCAEGIESIADLKVLADLGVTYGQGYAIAHPAPEWPEVPDDVVLACRERRAGFRLVDGARGA